MRKLLFLSFLALLLLAACSNVDTKIRSLITGHDLIGKWQCDFRGVKGYMVFNENGEFASWNQGDSIVKKSGVVKGPDGVERRVSFTYSIDNNSDPIKVALTINSAPVVELTAPRTQHKQDLADAYKNAPSVGQPTDNAPIRRSFKDFAQYTVDTGDNLSLIAKRFNIKPETLIWENGLTLTSVLRIGQKLNIPPADGISHRVTTGQSVEKIAALYKVNAQKIVAMNNLQSGVITQGQIIFVPDAEPLLIVQPVAKDVARFDGSDAMAVNISATVVFVDNNTIEMNLRGDGSSQESQICVRQD